MFHRRALLLGMCAAMLAGCTTARSVVSTSWLDRRKAFQGPTGSDVVYVQSSLVERRPGDRYLNEGLWRVADEQVVPLEQKAVLVDNGFRVGQIGGLLPAPLQDLLNSEMSCPDPRRKQLHAGNPMTLAIGPRVATSQFQVHMGPDPFRVELQDAEYVLQVVPTLEPDGRIRLHFMPVVCHGAPAREPRPADDRSGWVMREEQPTERFPALGWEVVLSANECVVVGGRADRTQTVGHQCFIRDQEAVPVQRLLVLCAGRASAGDPDAAVGEPVPEYSLLSKSPPLALTAGLTAIRGR
jgi:hypothetical protein